jgi:hypothetical protein
MFVILAHGRLRQDDSKFGASLLDYIVFFFFSFFFYYSYVHTRLGSFLPPAPTTHSTPSRSPPSIPSRNYFALISNFVVERV